MLNYLEIIYPKNDVATITSTSGEAVLLGSAIIPADGNILGVFLRRETAPATLTDFTYDIRKGVNSSIWATIFANPAHKPTLIHNTLAATANAGAFPIAVTSGQSIGFYRETLSGGGAGYRPTAVVIMDDGTSGVGNLSDLEDVDLTGLTGGDGIAWSVGLSKWLRVAFPVDGADGTDGTIWRDGSGVPSNGTGVDGDYYLRTSNGDVYKRASGTYSVVGNIKGANGSNGTNGTNGTNGQGVPTGGSTAQVLAKINGTDYNTQWVSLPYEFGVAVSDETTAITTGTAKITFHVIRAFTLTDIWAALSTVSSSGLPTVNIKKNGTTIFSTDLSIDATEFTSLTANTPYVLSGATSFAIGDKVEIDITVAGTGAKGLKVYFAGTRS